MAIIRNILMLFLLTLSSFGNIVCTESIEANGNQCHCPLLIGFSVDVFGGDHGLCACLCDFDSAQPDTQADTGSKQCADELQVTFADILPSQPLPASPAWQIIDLNHAFLAPVFAHLSCADVDALVSTYHLWNALPIPKRESSHLSSVVLRL